jgi:hypothetical protein
MLLLYIYFQADHVKEMNEIDKELQVYFTYVCFLRIKKEKKTIFHEAKVLFLYKTRVQFNSSEQDNTKGTLCLRNQYFFL